MGIIDKFKDIVGIEEIDDDEYEEEVKTARDRERRPVDVRPTPNRYERDNVLNMSASRPSPSPAPVQGVKYQTKPMKLVVIDPTSFDECPRLVDNLKAKKPVIINLEKVESDTARKVFDFLSGATYALNGNVQKIANNIFVFAPENVDISEGMDKTNFEFSAKPNGSWR